MGVRHATPGDLGVPGVVHETHDSVWSVMARQQRSARRATPGDLHFPGVGASDRHRKVLGHVADRSQELLQHRLLPVAVEAETDTQETYNSCERKGD